MAQRTARKARPVLTSEAHADSCGGRITWNRDDGYIAYQDGVCVSEVVSVDEGILVLADYRTRERARRAGVQIEQAPRCELCDEPAELVGEQWVCFGCGPS